MTHPTRTYLFRSHERIIGCALALAVCGAEHGHLFAQASRPLLTRISEVRQLTPEEAQRRPRVRLRGVVTYYGEKLHAIFLHDAGVGIYIRLKEGIVAPQPGDRVQVEGQSRPGMFAPQVHASRVEFLGRGAMPEAKAVTYEELAAGSEDSGWVEIRGTLRSVAPSDAGGIILDLAISGGRINCIVNKAATVEADPLVNAVVRVSGVCLSRYNHDRQLLAPRIAVMGLDSVKMERPAPAEPPESPIAELLRFNPKAVFGERVMVRGVVTFAEPGGPLFIENEGIGVRIKGRRTTRVAPGELIEVVGFTALGPFKPVLEDAIYRRVGFGAPSPANRVDAAEASTGRHDGSVVRIEARVVSRVQRGNEHVLIVAAGDSLFNARFAGAGSHDALEWLRNDSRVALTGVCVMQPGEDWPSARSQPEPFLLLLRSLEDVVVLEEPSWWTLPRLIGALGISAVAALAAATWVIVLRRRVRTQTKIIEHKIQREAVLEERSRLARELHDTLEQELAAITMQLDAAQAQIGESPRRAGQLLELARTMSRRSFSEVRRSVWDLRSHFLETSGLSAALAEAVKPLTARASADIRVQTTGTPRPLPSRLENHLLRIGQEAVTNAVKHSGATEISVELAYEPRLVRLRIRDNGCGFDADAPTAVSGGHFGVLDMRERAGKLGCQLQVQSRPGLGTDIAAEVFTGANGHDAGPLPAR